MTDWPENVVRFAGAVAKAEGYGIPGAIPTLANNPCDLTTGDSGSFETDGVMNKENVVRFVHLDDGWQAAFVKFNRIFAGRSLVYPLTMTLREMGIKYSGGRPEWAVNVARELGVSQDITLADLALSNPS